MSVCLCWFYLKAIIGNDLILFATWRSSSSSSFKILTKFLWLYVKWLISQLVNCSKLKFIEEFSFFVIVMYFHVPSTNMQQLCSKRFNSIGNFKSLTFQLRATYFHTFAVDMSVDPLSEGLVTPPLGVEKLSPRLKIKFSCITWLKLNVWGWLRAH